VSDFSERIRGQRVVICAGPGGVGKTTVSAAVGAGLVQSGRRVVVVTVDPARRLAEALGLRSLGNEPQRIDPARFAAAGLELEGELSAMMLDVKRTFDELISSLAPDGRTAEEIMENPVYQQLSTAIAGSQEYTAMAKLFELVAENRYDTIVLDTPPSRSAIDFLRAPERLIRFLEGRALQTLLRPSGLAARSAGFVLSALRRITGVTFLEDLSTFFRLLGGVLGAFRTRASEVHGLLTDTATGFIVVASPESAAVEEAIHFASELERGGMHRSALILNRVQPLDPDEHNPEQTAARLADTVEDALARKVARTHAELQLLARRDRASVERLEHALEDSVYCLADREAALQDVRGLCDLRAELFG
jgi:anion-transporting  ArsA/GET3 family ATPase